MKYRLWQLGWVVSTLAIVTMLSLGFAAVWVEPGETSENLGMSAFILLFPIIFGAGGMAAWTSEYPSYEREQDKPEPRLPRAERKKLKQAEVDARLQAAIKRLEREELNR